MSLPVRRWQFLKIWPDEPGWSEEEAMEAFRATVAIRYPRGRGAAATGAYWAENRSRLGYVEARKRIYIPCYKEMLETPDRVHVLERLRELAMQRNVWVWDPDSYDYHGHGLSDIVDTVNYEKRPFAHAFLVAIAVQGRLNAWRP
jgi:hypothetical protein